MKLILDDELLGEDIHEHREPQTLEGPNSPTSIVSPNSPTIVSSLDTNSATLPPTEKKHLKISKYRKNLQFAPSTTKTKSKTELTIVCGPG